MAEEKEEGKFAPTPDGESIKYVSLEDALAMAIRHAWWHPEIYGVEYQDVSLTWKSVSQEENEEFYDIKLSFCRSLATGTQ